MSLQKTSLTSRSQDTKRLSEIERLKELLLKTDARLSEDGKSIKCLLCGKSLKVDKCKRSAEGHIKYFNRVHSCTPKTTNLETSQAKIKDLFGPAEKRQKTSESDSDTDSGDENEHADQTVISVMQPTHLGRTRRLTQRMMDYLQS